MRTSHISLSCSLILSRMVSLFPDVHFAALASNYVVYAILAAGGSRVFSERTKCDRIVLSDFKKVLSLDVLDNGGKT